MSKTNSAAAATWHPECGNVDPRCECGAPLEDDGSCDVCLSACVDGLAGHLVSDLGREGAVEASDEALVARLNAALAEDAIWFVEAAELLPGLRLAICHEVERALLADDGCDDWAVCVDRDRSGNPIPF